MSPRAGCGLEHLGFAQVYDYVAGKVDWMAAGLPTIRADTTERRAIDAVDAPPTCAPDTLLRDLAVAKPCRCPRFPKAVGAREEARPCEVRLVLRERRPSRGVPESRSTPAPDRRSAWW